MKKLLTYFLAAVLLLAGVWHCCTVSPDSGDAVPILMYHDIGTYSGQENTFAEYYVSAESFENQLRALAAHGYTGISLSTLLSHWNSGTPLPEKAVVITFDDGYRRMYEDAYRLLKQVGFSATFFVFTDIVGTEDGLSADMLREMRENGMEIASHSVSHCDLSTLSEEALAQELSSSKALLAEYCGQDVETLSYPFGKSTAAVWAAAEAAGYTAAVNTEYGIARLSSDRFMLPRIAVLADDRSDAILFKIAVLGF